jgi:crotonobetainyl-CoA:carnitine CoA-transferase CaiB-like acyl-CoA transferase
VAHYPARRKYERETPVRDLEGILVVSLEQAVAAPYASCKLADSGARVIKIERPEGDFARGYDKMVNGQSAYFVWLNRGKESVCLDLKASDDLAVLHNIAAEADVFIQNLAPGAAARLGLGSEALTKTYPRLIYCSISGYGEHGPYRDQKAYDMLIQGESGLIAINGTAEEQARVGLSICDICAGITAYGAILQALLARARTGTGRTIEVSLFHAIGDWMNVPYLQTRYSNRPPSRVGIRHPSIAPYGAFNCKDGKAVLLSIQSEREWLRFCGEVLGQPELATDRRFATNMDRAKNAAELDSIISKVLSLLDRESAIAILTQSAIACGRLSDMADLVAHPQNRLIAVDTPSGTIEMLAPGAQFAEPERFGAVPSLGADTKRVKSQFARTGVAT